MASSTTPKIDIADEILVVDPNGYIGNSTKRAINYATQQRKRIRRVSQEKAERKQRREEEKARVNRNE